MSNFYESVRSERQLKALTGLGREKFEILLEKFSESLEELKSENYRVNRYQRSRRPGGGRKGRLSTAQDKLLFILNYLKTYPTFDSLGFTFKLSVSKASENVKKLLPVLNLALSKLKVQPLRKLSKVSDLESALEALNSPEDRDSEPALEVLNSPEDRDSKPALEALDSSEDRDSEPALEALESLEDSVGSKWHGEVSVADEISVPALKKAQESQVSNSLRLKLKALYERENPSDSSDLEEEVLYERENPGDSSDLEEEVPYDVQVLAPTSNQTKEEPEVLIDVTERTHFRHQKNAKQKKHYSGKKGTHTVKNTVISTPNRSVVFWGKTFPRSVHDYKMLKSELSPKKTWWSKIKATVDLGYQGIKTDFENPENIPHKKPRKSKFNPNPTLTNAQKRYNKKVAQRRIFVEHTIGGMKAFHILSTRFRNRKDNMADEVAFLVAGLWNLKKLVVFLICYRTLFRNKSIVIKRKAI